MTYRKTRTEIFGSGQLMASSSFERQTGRVPSRTDSRPGSRAHSGSRSGRTHRPSSGRPPVPGSARAGAILPRERIVAYYGNPLSSQMGILGEPPPENLSRRLQDQAAEYARVNRVALSERRWSSSRSWHRRGLGRMDSIAFGWTPSLSRTSPVGRTGRTPSDSGRAARSRRHGRGGEWLQPFLKRPNVHLALDSEFAMRPTQSRVGTWDQWMRPWSIVRSKC